VSRLYDVAIIGGGASGALLALHLRRKSGHCRTVVIERSGQFGRGVAYSTDRPFHLLNTRAKDMSAWPEEPAHFTQWLEACRMEGSNDFVPRSLFGDYLAQLFADAVSGEALAAIKAEVAAIQLTQPAWRLDLTDGRQLHATHVVIATGHSPPSADQEGWHGNPWLDANLDGLSDEEPILLLGTGLTAVDVIASLLARDHRGKIVAVSRRGLSPRTHRPAGHGEAELSGFLAGPLSQRLRSFRKLQRAGHDWQSLMHAIRPRNAEVWRSLDAVQRGQFLRHLRPWWDVHRHRMAPEMSAMIDNAVAREQLEILAGHAEVLDAGPASISVRLRPRHRRQSETRHFARVIDCRGSECGVSERNLLVSRLARDGIVASDPLGLGLAVDNEDRAIDTSGKASNSVSVLGPPTRGHHWESTAIPDIRLRAARLAERLAAEVGRAC